MYDLMCISEGANSFFTVLTWVLIIGIPLFIGVGIPIILIMGKKNQVAWFRKNGMVDVKDIGGVFFYSVETKQWGKQKLRRIFKISDVISAKLRVIKDGTLNRYYVHIETDLLDCPLVKVYCGNGSTYADEIIATIKMLQKRGNGRCQILDYGENSDDVSKY